MREVDGLVYTEEEVNLERLEKHIFVWKLDLEGGVGESNLHLEALLAKRLMRESALLMQTLRSYAVPKATDSVKDTEPVVRGELGIAPRMYKPQPLVREETASRKSLKKTPDRQGGATWAGGYVEEENSIKRVKRNVFGDIMHQLFGVATDEQLQQQLRVDEELRDKVADTLTRQVYYEKELTMAVGNITMEEDKLESRVSELEQKHKSDKDRDSRMAAHRFTLMEDVDRLEDVLEAVVTGGVNTRHAAFLSTKAGLSRVASYEFLNLTIADGKNLVVCYLTRLFNEVVVEVVATSATTVQIRTPTREYYLHASHGPEMPLTEMEVQGTRDGCDGCALLVHTGNRRYLVVESGELTCEAAGSPSVLHNMSAGEILSIKRDAVCKNRLMLVSSRGRHVSHYAVSASGADPIDSLVLRRKERVDQRLDGSHSVISTHSALNMHLRQNLGMAQQDIENLVAETQESFKMYTVVSSGTTAWLSLITLLAILLICLIVRKVCQRRHESDDTMYVPSLSS
jgi:hypothetical protein